MNARELGLIHGCLDKGLKYEDINKIIGFEEEFQKSASETNNKKALFYKLSDIVLRYGGGEFQNKTAAHLDGAASKEGWDEHREDLYNDTLKIVTINHLEKSSSTITSLASPVARAYALALAAAGVVGGATVHHLKKDTKQETAESEKLKQQIRHYRQLAADLEKSLAEKYDYVPQDE